MMSITVRFGYRLPPSFVRRRSFSIIASSSGTVPANTDTIPSSTPTILSNNYYKNTNNEKRLHNSSKKSSFSSYSDGASTNNLLVKKCNDHTSLAASDNHNHHSSSHFIDTIRASTQRRITNGMNHHHHLEQDRLIVIGSGVAGCATALIAAECYQIPVTMIYAGGMPTDCNSYWAQGGIIYRNYDSKYGDGAESLSDDIQKAGAGLCIDDAVWKVATEGPSRVKQLLLDVQNKFANVPFDRDPKTNELSLCLEASHSAPRILHKADHTGAIITQHITAAAHKHPLITAQANTVVTDLIVENNICIGIESLNRLTGRRNNNIYTNKGIVLASGGLAGIYQHTTNPPGFNALGSSVALAARTNQVQTDDLEYVQFHPTALYIPNEARFLLTEALRGEGAILRNSLGHAFCKDYHPNGELAPRDIVARAVFQESQKATDQEQHSVFLDITHRDSQWVRDRFPTIQRYLQQRGYDLANDLLPITPAAHYTCGGITTDLMGRTTLKGLYAAGEAARTGLHGGNRLASTSLLEGLVFGSAVADFVASEEGKLIQHETSEVVDAIVNKTYHYINNANTKGGAVAASSPRLQMERRQHYHNYSYYYEPYHIENASYRSMQLLDTVRKTMWDYVGVVRTVSGLNVAVKILHDIQLEMEHIHRSCPTLETAAVRDAAMAGYQVARAAQNNHRSIGAHCIMDDSADNNITKTIHNNNMEDDDEYTAQVADMR